jgi:hypothetical protein
MVELYAHFNTKRSNKGNWKGNRVHSFLRFLTAAMEPRAWFFTSWMMSKRVDPLRMVSTGFLFLPIAFTDKR